MCKILVADDNSVSRELIREVLDGCGYDLVEAADGLETVRQVRKTRPDLVLMDLQMPEMDGLTAIRVIRGDPDVRHTKVVALTAFAMQGDRERAIQAGFDDYVTKPIKIATFRDRVADWLKG
jgi:two-component system cell cycle response regulator DivK